MTNLNASQLTSGTLGLGQLPSAVVTNNDTSVTLSNVTLTGTLNLPSAGAINAGGNSLLYADGADDFYAGPGAGSVAVSATDSTGIGYGSLASNSNGDNNTAIGYQSLNNNTNGAFNVASGGRALFNNTSGNNNTADGRRALYANTSGSDNTAIGYQALENDTGGSQNTAVGSSALGSSAGGSNNIALGYGAGGNFTGGASSNIDIGNPGVSGDNNIIRLGSGQTSAFIAGVINGNGAGLTNLNVSAAQVTGLPNLKQIALLKWGVSSADNTFSAGYISQPSAICFDGANIWVCDYYDVVTELNASTGASNGTYTVGEVPDAICFDGASIWVANQQDATVTKLNAGTGATIGTYNVDHTPMPSVSTEPASGWRMPTIMM